jgi:hypothetical protein
MKEGRLIDFRLLDPSAKRAKQAERREYANLYRVMKFGSISFLYSGLVLFSLIIGVIAATR